MQARLSESRIALERALTLDPNFEWANMQLGWTLMFLGECGRRDRPRRKKPAAEPRDPNIHYRYELLRYCHLVLNHVDEAIDLLIKGRTANPRD
jgi:tetratricopeptide (TPR) repeat protein